MQIHTTINQFNFMQSMRFGISCKNTQNVRLDVSTKNNNYIKKSCGKDFCSFTFKANVGIYEQAMKVRNIKKMNIGNLQFVGLNGLRGETLSSKRHKRFLPLLKENGITSVIDLRDKFTNENYGEMCKEAGLKYYHIPVDSFKIDTSKIIEKMPLLFKIMNKENYYMACALGLHRTDIAQTINYLFNPIAYEVPVMYGHQRNGIFKRDDIMRRIGSVKKEITPAQLKSLGWDSEKFESIYQQRKEKYIHLNNEWAKKEIL